MKIERADIFCVASTEAEARQEICLVRLRAGGLTGWGECGGPPLLSIAAFAGEAMQAAVLGQELHDVADVQRIAQGACRSPHAAHALSGVEMALWDLLGKGLGQPAYRLLGYANAFPKLPYASLSFGLAPKDTYERARQARGQGFRAARFGWAGAPGGADEIEHCMAARHGIGEHGILLLDLGSDWRDDDRSRRRIRTLQECRATWLQEPFAPEALEAHQRLALQLGTVKLATGATCLNFEMARNLVDHGGIGAIQVDVSRIGGLAAARRVASYASQRGVTYVNRAAGSQLQLSASLQPYAGSKDDVLAEYPAEAGSLAVKLTPAQITPDADGFIHVPDAPGLGVQVEESAVREHLVDLEIRVQARIVYRTPTLD